MNKKLTRRQYTGLSSLSHLSRLGCANYPSRRSAMHQSTTHTTARDVDLTRHALIGGAIIDAQGREIPITENMIQHACRELEKQLRSDAKRG